MSKIGYVVATGVSLGVGGLITYAIVKGRDGNGNGNGIEQRLNKIEENLNIIEIGLNNEEQSVTVTQPAIKMSGWDTVTFYQLPLEWDAHKIRYLTIEEIGCNKREVTVGGFLYTRVFFGGDLIATTKGVKENVNITFNSEDDTRVGVKFKLYAGWHSSILSDGCCGFAKFRYWEEDK